MNAQGGGSLALLDADLCSATYPGKGPDFGLLCNALYEHDGNHRALAEVWPGHRRFVVWTPADVVLPNVEVQR